jgi:uncharacterized protein YueI
MGLITYIYVSASFVKTVCTLIPLANETEKKLIEEKYLQNFLNGFIIGYSNFINYVHTKEKVEGRFVIGSDLTMQSSFRLKDECLCHDPCRRKYIGL